MTRASSVTGSRRTLPAGRTSAPASVAVTVAGVRRRSAGHRRLARLSSPGTSSGGSVAHRLAPLLWRCPPAPPRARTPRQRPCAVPPAPPRSARARPAAASAASSASAASPSTAPSRVASGSLRVLRDRGQRGHVAAGDQVRQGHALVVQLAGRACTVGWIAHRLLARPARRLKLGPVGQDLLGQRGGPLRVGRASASAARPAAASASGPTAATSSVARTAADGFRPARAAAPPAGPAGTGGRPAGPRPAGRSTSAATPEPARRPQQRFAAHAADARPVPSSARRAGPPRLPPARVPGLPPLRAAACSRAAAAAVRDRRPGRAGGPPAGRCPRRGWPAPPSASATGSGLAGSAGCARQLVLHLGVALGRISKHAAPASPARRPGHRLQRVLEPPRPPRCRSGVVGSSDVLAAQPAARGPGADSHVAGSSRVLRPAASAAGRASPGRRCSRAARRAVAVGAASGRSACWRISVPGRAGVSSHRSPRRAPPCHGGRPLAGVRSSLKTSSASPGLAEVADRLGRRVLQGVAVLVASSQQRSTARASPSSPSASTARWRRSTSSQELDGRQQHVHAPRRGRPGPAPRRRGTAWSGPCDCSALSSGVGPACRACGAASRGPRRAAAQASRRGGDQAGRGPGRRPCRGAHRAAAISQSPSSLRVARAAGPGPSAWPGPRRAAGAAPSPTCGPGPRPPGRRSAGRSR